MLGYPAGLTRREFQTLELLAEGLTNPEICERLHYGVSSVKYHMENMFNKLGVTNRTQAVGVAYRRGILPIDSDIEQ